VRRTATTEQVAAALNVKPATVRKYAREHRLPYDTTPGGHRRFDVDEAVAAVLGVAGSSGGHPAPDAGAEAFDPGALARVRPATVVPVATSVTGVRPAPVIVRDDAAVLEDWAAGVPVV
jgi:excisionase family DNA binding protein